MENSDYPNYIPQDVIAAHKKVLFNWGEEGADIAQRLIFRPCMKKVYRDVGKLLNGLPEETGPSGSVGTPWDWFFEIIVTMEGDYEDVVKNIKPARKELKKRMEKIKESGTKLIADLKWAMSGVTGLSEILPDGSRQHNQYHGLSVPEEFRHFGVVEKIVEAASRWDAQSAYDDFAKISGIGVFTKSTPEIRYAQAVHALLRDTCDRGLYGFPAVEKFKLPHLLSYDNYARITRAALDLPDDLGPYRRPFSGEDLRLAKAFT